MPRTISFPTAEGARLGALLRRAGAAQGDLAALASLLCRRVAVSVFLGHRSEAAEDYDILCDFTDLLTGGAPGAFRVPEMTVMAGRTDIDRTVFAGRVRAAFLDQFEQARAAFAADHAEERVRRKAALRSAGWGATKLALAVPLLLLRTNPLVNLAFLALSVAGGRQTVEGLGWAAINAALGRGDRSAELAARAPEFQRAIDKALARIDIGLHPALWRAAHFPGMRPLPMTGMDRAAWPLPDWISRSLSGSGKDLS